MVNYNYSASLLHRLSSNHTLVNQAIHALSIANQRIVNKPNPSNYLMTLKWLSKQLTHLVNNWINHIFYNNYQVKINIHAKTQALINNSSIKANQFLQEIKIYPFNPKLLKHLKTTNLNYLNNPVLKEIKSNCSVRMFKLVAHQDLFKLARCRQFRAICNPWMWKYINNFLEIENLLIYTYQKNGHHINNLKLTTLPSYPFSYSV